MSQNGHKQACGVDRCRDWRFRIFQKRRKNSGLLSEACRSSWANSQKQEIGKMSFEKTLNLVEAKRSAIANPTVTRRARLAQQIDEQLKLVEDAKAGLIRVPRKRVVSPSNGEGEGGSEAGRRPAPWWWMDSSGTYFLALRYARKPVELAKRKTAVKCASLDEVANALTLFRAEALKGTFDAALASIAQSVRQGFRSAKKA